MIKGTPTILTLRDFHIRVTINTIKNVFCNISAEILQIRRATSSVVQFIKTSKAFLHRMLRKGADPLGVKKVLVKMVNRHALQFEKYNTNNRDLIQELLT